MKYYTADIEDSMRKISNRYNGDHDLPSGEQPLVTWTDYELLTMIQKLMLMVKTLEERYEGHQHDSTGYMTWRP